MTARLPIWWALPPAALVLPLALNAQTPTSPPVELPPLRVTVDPLGQRIPDELAQPTVVLRGEALERQRSGTIGEVLAEVPGVTSGDFGPGVGRPVIRGQSGARVLVLDNGIRTMDVATIGGDHASAVDPLIAEQVEVIRGPYALVHGSGASGGVVNVRNRRINPDAAEGLSGSGLFRFGENGSERLGAANLELGTSGFNLQGDYAFRRAGEIDIPGFARLADAPGEDRRDVRGVLENSSLSSDGFGASATTHGGWGFFGLAVSRYETEYGKPEIEEEINGDERELEFERLVIKQTRYEARGLLNDPLPGFRAARLKLAYTDFEQQEVEFEQVFDGGVLELTERGVEAEFENKESELRIELEHLPLGAWRGVIGSQINQRKYSGLNDDGEPLYVPPTDSRSLALFIVEEAELAWGRVEVGARVERASLENQIDLTERRFTPVSASFGTIVDLDDTHHLKLYLTRTQRAPVAEELFADGRHPAAGTFERGDDGLKVETNNNLDLGFDRHVGPWLWQVNLFYNRAQNYIFLATDVDANGEPLFVNDEGEAMGNQRNLSTRYEQAGVDLYGFEAETRLPLIEGPASLHGRLFADLVRGSLRDSDGNLPRISPTRVGIAFDGTSGVIGYELRYTRVQSQDRVAVGERRTDGYGLLSADLSYRLATAQGPVRLALQGRNLLNEEARRHTSFFKDRAPLPGRSLFASIRYDFGS